MSSALSLPCAPGDVDYFLSEPNSRVIEVLARIPGPFLVLGAGGKMGLHLCLMLRRGLDSTGRKDAVTAVSRFSTLRDREEFEREGIIIHAADLANQPA